MSDCDSQGLASIAFSDTCGDEAILERLRENLADSTRKLYKNLYQNRLDGPIACHVLVQNSRFLKRFLVEIGQVFPQLLYLMLALGSGFRVERLALRVKCSEFRV